MEFVFGLITAAIIVFVWTVVTGHRRADPTPEPPPPVGVVTDQNRELLYEIARQFQSDVAHPRDLLVDPAFKRGVRMLSSRKYTLEELFGYSDGQNEALAYMALEAMTKRSESESEEMIDHGVARIGSTSPFGQYFILRILKAHAPIERPTVGEVLMLIAVNRHEGWLTMTASVDQVRQFAVERLDAGETPTLEGCMDGLDAENLEHLGKILDALKEPRLEPLRAEIEAYKGGHIDHSFMQGIGRVYGERESRTHSMIIEHDALVKHVDELQATLTSSTPRSVLLVGETGVGRSAIVSALSQRLKGDGWTVFEAGAADILAGQKYIGELEERIRELVQQLGGQRKILWVVPAFHRLAWAGRHQYSPVSILDLIMPYIEHSEMLVLGKTEPAAYERLIQERPSCATSLVGHRVAHLSEQETLSVALDWARLPAHGGEVASKETITEAWRLAQQYLADKAAPGNLLHFLQLTLESIRVSSDSDAAKRAIQTDDLVVTLSTLTGLPTSILDERETLDLDSLRRHFEGRVLGQSEAIECLVERVAMIKAHVTDPTRPLGVFLFAGPTGTGKTEIAKRLAEFLFGSPDRMIRLDMSEFQSEDSLQRIFGTSHTQSDAGTEGSLVTSIRKQPFSVVLLDEFEKAHHLVWDLFLQVFDDGRLTDRRGNLADFRQAVIILTSNLGGLVPTGTSLGFSKALEQFRPEAVRRTVERGFRREFVNRIDRVVVFHPLARETMREILVRQLEEAFQRRGLRNRGWAVEWEDAAIEFLLEKGFTADMGARPLKRAIDRYLLAPLAMTIVKHQYPQGDQFLFVSTQRDRLRVQFVDPDAPPEAAEVYGGEESPDDLVTGPAAATVDEAALDAIRTMRLENIVLQARGSAAEIECMRAHVAALQGTVEDEKWQAAKKGSLAQMSSVDFWNSSLRFAVLGEAEYLDRIEAGVSRSASLFQRLAGTGGDGRRHYPVDLVRQLGQQLFLLRVACDDVAQSRQREAFLALESSGPAAEAAAFGKRLGDMYQAWARKRRMQCAILDESASGATPYRLMLAVSGYGAHSLLESESGLHVYEVPEGDSGRFHRHQARVRVVAQPDEPVQGKGADRRARLLVQAREVLNTSGAPQRRVVRRYRDTPSPLVRDGVRGWRTGRIDLVLAGNFDLFAATGEAESVD